NHGGLDVRLLAPAEAGATLLALADLRRDLFDLDVVKPLNGALDLVLARPQIHLERVAILFVHGHRALLGHERLLDDDDVVHQAASSRAASMGATFADLSV